MLIILRPDLASEFVNTQTPEASNAFWHKHVARRKAAKFIYQHGYTYIPEPYESKELIIWRKKNDDILSMSAHPSHIAGAVRLMTAGSDGIWPGYLGARSGGSVQTLNYAVVTLLEFLLIANKIPFEQQGAIDPISTYQQDNEFHRHVECGRYVLASLILYVKDGKRDDELSEPEIKDREDDMESS